MQTVILDATTKTLKGVLAGAITTTQPDYVIAWADSTSTTFTEGSSNGAFNSTSDVTLVAAPAASTRRVIKSITVYNRDTASITFTLKFDDNGTQRFLTKQTLASGASWSSDDSGGGGGISGLTVGTTSVASGTSGNVLYNNAGTLGEYSSVPVSEGGTGATSASGARSNLLPSYTSNGGKVLALNSGATDVEWITGGSSNRNRLINGDFTIAQRGTSFTSSTRPANDDAAYHLDRWYILSDGNNVVDISRSTDAPTGQLYSCALDVTTINKKFGIAQVIEQKNCVDLIGNNVSLSFKAKVSSTTNLTTIKAAILSWSGTADTLSTSRDVVSAWNTGGTTPTFGVTDVTLENTNPASHTPTTSWATYKVENVAIDTANTKNIIVFIWSDVVATAGTDILYITDVQLEAGSVATSFERLIVSDSLARCRAYLQPLSNNTLNDVHNLSIWGCRPGTTYAAGPPAVGSAVVDTQLRFPSPMRVGPTLVINGATFVNAEPGTTANTYAIYGYTSDAYMSNVGSTTNETFFLRASTTVAALLRFGSFTSPSPVLTGTKGEMASVIFGGGVNMYLEAEL